ncbi:MAG: DUF4838 domain-containing protein [Phycisphaerae bacterium]
MQIAEGSKSEAVIIVSEKAPASVVYAAKELQTYLKRISGADLPILNSAPVKAGKILIYVGAHESLKSPGLDTSGLGDDGFKIISGNRWLALFGRDEAGPPLAGATHPLRLTESYSEKLKINRHGETGTLFAVYHFLERFCGVRWYMPGDLGEIVPVLKSVIMPENIDIKDTPDFPYRFLYSCDFRDDEDSAVWYRRAGFGAPFPVAINHSFFTTFSQYQKTNPEYFALRNGKRDFDISCMGHGNLCLSNPEVLKCFVKEAREFFDENPGQRIFSVMPNDAFNRICECQECQKQIDENNGTSGKFSNYVWKFVNNVAKELCKSHPDRFIGCCAYGAYLNPPEISEKFSPNVVVMVCKSSSEYWNSDYKKQIIALVESWNSKIHSGNLYCWEYYNWAGFIPYLRNVPVVFPHIIAEDLRFFRGKSKGEFLEAQTWSKGTKERKNYFPGLTHLNHYVTAKLMWNADADVDSLLDEYYALFYGPASSEMKSFWEKSEELWSRNLPDRNNEFYRKLYTAQEVGGLMSCLRGARAKTADGSFERRRIDLIIAEIAPLETRVTNTRLTDRPQYTCQHVSSAPKIDGESDDQCWMDLLPMEFVSKTGEVIPHASKAMACFDEKNLYLFFANYVVGADTVGLKALCNQRDSSQKPYIWEDESIELFLNPTQGPEKRYYQFIVNARGTVWDGCFSKEFDKIPSSWNSGIEAAVKVHADSWTLEVRIPLSDIGLENKDLKAMPITGNFMRNRPEGNDIHNSCWSPTLEASYHNTAQFGKLTFTNKSTAKTVGAE